MRNSGPIWAVALTLLVGCDFFSTRDILPKPSDIRSFQGFSKAGDSIVFRMTETLRDSGLVKEALSKRRMVFTLMGDSIVSGDTLKNFTMRVTEDPTGYLLEKSTRLLHFSKEGVLLVVAPEGGGTRFYPLKNSASQDTLSTFSLPAILIDGWQPKQKLGILELQRVLSSGSDTLKFKDHSEATWKIFESITDRGLVLAKGQYWYGASGLLKADQTWPGFGWREANASVPGHVDLHRTLERL